MTTDEKTPNTVLLPMFAALINIQPPIVSDQKTDNTINVFGRELMLSFHSLHLHHLATGLPLLFSLKEILDDDFGPIDRLLIVQATTKEEFERLVSQRLIALTNLGQLDLTVVFPVSSTMH